MINQLLATHKRLLAATYTQHHRYLFESFKTDGRLVGLIGARGTGKTEL